MSDILEKLRGGDRRSIGQADKVAHEVGRNPSLFNSLFNGLFDGDPVVRMRSADAIEKLTKNKPELLSAYKSKVIALLASAKQQEVCWHLAQIAPRLNYNESEESEMVASLKVYLLHQSRIVQVSALEALAIIAEKNNSLRAEVVEIIAKHEKTGSPAVQSRSRKLLQRLRSEQFSKQKLA